MSIPLISRSKMIKMWRNGLWLIWQDKKVLLVLCFIAGLSLYLVTSAHHKLISLICWAIYWGFLEPCFIEAMYGDHK